MNFIDLLDYYVQKQRLANQEQSIQPVNNFNELVNSYQNNNQMLPPQIAQNTPVQQAQIAQPALPAQSTQSTQPAQQMPGSSSNQTINNAIRAAAQKYGVDPLLVREIIRKESGFNPNARNATSGATGLMQMIPSTARSMGVTNPTNIQQNISGGTRYLAQMLKQFGGDKEKALAAYNAGPGNVRKYGGIPPFKETQNYVSSILGNVDKYNQQYAKGNVQPAMRKIAPTAAKIATNKGQVPETDTSDWGSRPPLKGGFKFNRTLPNEKYGPNQCGRYVREVLGTYGWSGHSISDLKNPKYGVPISGNEISPGTVVRLREVKTGSGGYSTNHYALVMQGKDGGLYLNELVTGKDKGHRVSTDRTLESQAYRITNAWNPRGLNAKTAAKPQVKEAKGIVERVGNFFENNVAKPFLEATQEASKNMGNVARSASQIVAQEEGRQSKTAKGMHKSNGVPVPKNLSEAFALIQNSGIDAFFAGGVGKNIGKKFITKPNTANRFLPKQPGNVAKAQGISSIEDMNKSITNIISNAGKKTPLGDIRVNMPKGEPLGNIKVTIGQTASKIAKQTAAPKSTQAKVAEAITQVMNVPRTLLTTGDLSAAGRQGAKLIGEKEYWTSLPKMIKSAFSERYFQQLHEELMLTPGYSLGKKAGLYIAPPGKEVALTQAEENYLGRLLYKVPGIGQIVRGSSRAYDGFLNPLRQGVFNKLSNAMGPNATAEDLKQAAHFVNAATGRGSLGKLETSALALSNAMFSPRFLASLVQYPLTAGSSNATVRNAALKNIAAFTSAGMSAAALLKYTAGATVELDPRSSDFGKAKIGNTRFDFFGGYNPLIRYGTQILTGQSKNVNTGKINDVNRLETLGRFARSKASPGVGMAMSALSGKSFIGENIDASPESLKQQAYSSSVPMNIQDTMGAATRQEYGKNNSLLTATVGAASTLGIGTQTYNPFENMNIKTQQGQDYWSTRLAAAKYVQGNFKTSVPSQPKQRALWYMRNALVDNDIKTAKTYFYDYIKAGGKPNGARQSLMKAGPLASLELEDKAAFMKSLKPADKKRVMQALIHWEIVQARFNASIDIQP